MRNATRTRKATTAAIVLLFVLLLTVPGAAAPLPATQEVPRIVIVARNDNPADALAAGPIAGALGGVVLITPPGSLSPPALGALVEFAPDRVYIAGGAAAISDEVEAALNAAGPWEVVRRAGPTRDHTAAALAGILAEVGVQRPALAASGQVVGDVRVGGLVHADRLAVESTDHVANLNADLLDGLDSDDFVQRGDRGVAVAGMRITGTGSGFIEQWFNTAGGKPTMAKVGTGIYDIQIDGRALTASDHVAIATFPGINPGFASVSHLGQGLRVRTFDATGSLTDRIVYVVVFDASTGG